MGWKLSRIAWRSLLKASQRLSLRSCAIGRERRVRTRAEFADQLVNAYGHCSDRYECGELSSKVAGVLQTNNSELLDSLGSRAKRYAFFRPFRSEGIS